MQRFLLVIIVSSFIFGFSRMAEAVGVAVKPKEINLAVAAGEKAKTEFLVINSTGEPAIYQVILDGQNSAIKIQPSEFLLASGQSQIIKIAARFFWPKNYSGLISVIARPPGASGLITGSGVKLPIRIEVYGRPWILLSVSIIFCCLLIVFVVFLKKKVRF
ncbi:MAG: hypothetical protein A2729_05455 [Candidatus Buchananbacteria bacterium RIFCSPHIGHO2_01_FULL_39_14]|uniref:Uncharacterized protein n=1 Tax=Candidatus Buchananbacteria bacterium RIFCSPHIGHO2_01_FULL_39_14 TaxID=1797532 RepID=A0A1G1XYU6_9BACT|nr:MAG: hypothetical protein A2729_05455 [Candidatus Buchananbacteria bacterium RIFCSPHIGHO2_01_FULL_39_14]OGY48389.1 MAG: hypothetical protein A3D39_01540 [Candidatus Buchananbacteria bacterium RIFCSPHIGHO2_02_FULL_39_17]